MQPGSPRCTVLIADVSFACLGWSLSTNPLESPWNQGMVCVSFVQLFLSLEILPTSGFTRLLHDNASGQGHSRIFKTVPDVSTQLSVCRFRFPMATENYSPPTNLGYFHCHSPFLGKGTS